MNDQHRVNRRHFIGSLLAAAAAPQFVPARVLGGDAAPSRKIRLGHIGNGQHGQSCGSGRAEPGDRHGGNNVVARFHNLRARLSVCGFNNRYV